MKELNKRIKELKQELKADPTSYEANLKLNKLLEAKSILEEV